MVTELTAWFYSSLAQVSAAIVSIIGAVFLSRLTSHAQSTHQLFDAEQRALVTHLSNVESASNSIVDQTNLNLNEVSQKDRSTLATIAKECRQLKGRARPTQTRALCDELIRYQATLGSA